MNTSFATSSGDSEHDTSYLDVNMTLQASNVLKSSRLIYRAVEDSDDPFLSNLHQDPQGHLNTTPFFPTPQGKKSAVEHREHFATCMLSAVICISDPDRTPIGILTLKDANPPNGRHTGHCKLGISIHSDYHRKGYGYEAVKWLVDWSFRWGGLRKVSLYVYEHNRNAIKLYEKIGFVLEGRLREEAWADGKWWDDLIYSMLKREWEIKCTSEVQDRIA